jgi:outer membrane immunogenic protein
MRLAGLTLSTFLTVTSAHAQDWSGFYGGASFGASDGKQTTSGREFPLSGSAPGLFVGHNWQSGNLVYGAELAYSDGGITLDRFPQIEYHDVIDLKARFGLALGRTLAYGVVGWSQAVYVNGAFTDKPDGGLFGVGADRMFSDKVFGGIEVLYRRTDFPLPNAVGGKADNDITTVALRLGIKF